MNDENERSVASTGSVANRTTALMLAGQCWCDPKTSGIEVDARLANSFADRVVPLLDEIDRLRRAIRSLVGH